MRKYERHEPKRVDPALIDLRDQRDQLSIEISLLEDKDDVDPSVLFTMHDALWHLDARILKS